MDFRKTRQLRDKKAEKMYAYSELLLKQSKIAKRAASDHLIQSSIEQPTKKHIQQKQSVSFTKEDEEDGAYCPLFMIKNLDSNKVQFYQSEDQLEEKLLKDLDDLPEIQKLLEAIWEKYLTEKQKEEEQFLEACYQGDVNIVKKVIESKNKFPIDPTMASTDEGKNGIHLATISGSYRNTQIIKVLVQYKVDINGRTKQQERTPLMLGCILGNTVAIKQLIKLGANMKLQDYEGNTALHHACIFNQEDCVEILLQNKFPISLDIKNHKQLNAIQCVSHNSPAIMELMSKYYSNCAQYQEKDVGEEEGEEEGEVQEGKEEDATLRKSHMNQISKLLKRVELAQSIRNSVDQSEMETTYESSMQKKYLRTANQNRQDKIKQIAIKEIKSVGLSDFKKLSLLGRGAFGEVYLVENTLDSKRYAMKVLDKGSIMRQNILRYAMTERKILSTINHSFIVKLHFAFQNAEKLFLVMDYCPGGDLLCMIKKTGKIEEHLLKKYVAEITLAIEALHRAEIIYRDLKPSNIIIDEKGHACLTDFGLSKEASLSHSFCGSTAYLAPEMLWRRGHTKVLDWYLLGVLIYEGLTGKPPFWDSNKEQLLANIKSGRYKHLGQQFSKEVRDLVEKLLRSNSNKRLGINGSNEIKSHAWFSDLDWSLVEQRGMEMPVPEEVKGKAIKQQSFEEKQEIEGKNKVNGWDYVPKKNLY